MKDKFIMMDVHDERSRKVAHILGNKTCKKIINFLSETSEASEKDIADALGIPLNTTEYNLKKLIKVGLVDKTKNFFWSKRGKKIPMYKMAKKHIVISPRSKPSTTALKAIIPVIAIIAAALLLMNYIPDQIPGDKVPIDVDQTSIKTFQSYEELTEFLEDNQDEGEYYGDVQTFAMEDSASAVGAAEKASGTSGVAPQARASDYSETNIQVEGVDEPDIVKNDGKYIYVVSGSQVILLNAYPAENMEILSKINVSGVRNIFINEDKLVTFSNDYKDYGKTLIKVYDIADRSDPELEIEYSIDGYYMNARMIGDYVYVIANQNVRSSDPILPMVEVDGVREAVAVTDIAYFPYPDSSYSFTNILAVNLEDGEHESKTYLTGASHNIYVSEDNIYLTYLKRIRSSDYFEEMVETVYKKILPASEYDKIEEIMESDDKHYIKQREIAEIVEDYSMSLKGEEKADFDMKLQEELEEFSINLQKRTEKTIIHKINIDELDIDYIANGEVPGSVLNQFSMDEHEGNFRVATTTGNTWGWGSRQESLNHLFILDEDLEIIGSIEDLAIGERIYSARFMGDRAYMVTFRQVDPLYVLDLSDPEDPEVLGYLKVTGYSSYLHPYDENHIIGIGKEATEEGRVQGVKIALFDVSDVENPIEKAKYEVEGKWSNSNALHDHKAFLFDKDRELLVLPMNYNEEWINGDGKRKYEYWQGAFVFKINTDEISLRGKIDHKENKDEEGYYYGPYAVQRALYMDDTLYTISRTLVKANDLDSLDEINKVKLPWEDHVYYGRPGIVEPAVEVDTVTVEVEAVDGTQI